MFVAISAGDMIIRSMTTQNAPPSNLTPSPKLPNQAVGSRSTPSHLHGGDAGGNKIVWEEVVKRILQNNLIFLGLLGNILSFLQQFPK